MRAPLYYVIRIFRTLFIACQNNFTTTKNPCLVTYTRCINLPQLVSTPSSDLVNFVRSYCAEFVGTPLGLEFLMAMTPCSSVVDRYRFSEKDTHGENSRCLRNVVPTYQTALCDVPERSTFHVLHCP